MAFTPLKYKFDDTLLENLASKIEAVDSSFDRIAFIQHTSAMLKDLELKQRINCISDSFKKYLPGDYPVQLETLINILGPENLGSYGTFNDFFWTWPIATFIEKYGLEHEHISLKALKEVTKRGTSEFAIRPFIRQNPQKLLSIMNEWSLDENFHVRRLSSEGLRPNLPWSFKLKLFIENPQPVFDILLNLKMDSEKYVQKSVANHINDYLKVNEPMAMALIEEWSIHPHDNTKWILRHAIRNYRKKSINWAVELTNKLKE